MDIMFEGADEGTVTIDILKYIYVYKMGVLFEVSVMVGVIFGGVSEE